MPAGLCLYNHALHPGLRFCSSQGSPLLLFSAQIIAILSVLLLAFGYLRNEPHDVSARLFFVIALGIVCYLINGMSNQRCALMSVPGARC